MRKLKEFNGYSFSEKDHRKHMKYLVIMQGDLDINNAYAFTSKKNLDKYLNDENHFRDIYAVFKITDITP